MKKVLLALSLAAPAAFAFAADAEQLRCLGIADNVARLACYDAAAVAIRDAKPKAAPAAAVLAPAAASPSPAAVAVQNFGRSAPAQALDQLDSQIAGKFVSWTNGSNIRLANGQVWKILERGSDLGTPLIDPKVTIKPGFMGSYFMTVEGLSFQLKVRRVQ